MNRLSSIKYKQSKKYISLFAIFFLCIVTIVTALYREDKRILLSSDKSDNSVFLPAMNNPELIGYDNKNQLYKIMADKASKLDKNRVKFINPKGKITLLSGRIVDLSAKTAILDLSTDITDFQDDVVIDTNDGYHLETSSAVLYLKEDKIEGHEVTNIKQNNKYLRSQGFKLLNRGEIISFIGPVHVVQKPE